MPVVISDPHHRRVDGVLASLKKLQEMNRGSYKKPGHAARRVIGVRLAQNIEIGRVRECMDRDATVEQLMRHSFAIFQFLARVFPDISADNRRRKGLSHMYILCAKSCA